jgi:methylglutaconyl-CoA hydratase
MSLAEYVSTTAYDNHAVITFFHPSSNSLPGHILNQLAEAITAAGKNDQFKVILLQSAGEKAFCAGASFDELIAINDEATGLTFFSGFARVINAIRKCPKFVLGRIHGKAVGGGVGIASAVDMAFATSNASIKLSELAVGIGPFVVGPAVERKVGLSAFSQLAIDATSWYSAQWAYDKGLYAKVFDDVPSMDQHIDSLIQQLSKSNPEAMRALKTVFWEGTEQWDDLLVKRAGISGTLVLSDFTRHAIQSFKNK